MLGGPSSASLALCLLAKFHHAPNRSHNFHLPPGKKMSSSDRLLLKPTRDNKNSALRQMQDNSIHVLAGCPLCPSLPSLDRNRSSSLPPPAHASASASAVRDGSTDLRPELRTVGQRFPKKSYKFSPRPRDRGSPALRGQLLGNCEGNLQEPSRGAPAFVTKAHMFYHVVQKKDRTGYATLTQTLPDGVSRREWCFR